MKNKKPTYAIIGASNNPDKYGYKILKHLKEKGYNVIPINLKEKEILELKVYPKLSKVKEKIDTVIFVVPSSITETVLEDVKELKIKKVWMQPGSESKKAIEFCKKHKIECIYNACIMT
ncbi:MAG: CoA-binding protein [Nanoarchaeota archaeon]|nr:CoA-binding protein [Nanoarchaeota archaeon]